jgi:ATP-dependent helicase HrpB
VLPVESILGEIRAALGSRGAAVIHAPPGAGKTTLVPPALLGESWLGTGRIVMLEPRRLAARAAAHRMAHLRSEPVGRTIGYRTRLDSRVSRATRLEVVTEGVLTRMLQQDPTLEGYGMVIFDEFHERSLHGDVGLALVLHSRRLVRPDLRVLVMSATIDGTAVARLLDGAPVITSSGRQFDVETRFRPAPAGSRRIGAFDVSFVSGVIQQALGDAAGDVLVFLPGAPEIARVQRLLAESRLPGSVDVIALHGTLQPGEQDRAIAPAPNGRRKVVLATSIAETSLTIEGVRVVVDAGLARRSRFSPRTGMSRLETLRVSRASADQRRGRAGRTAPGVCYRLWAEAEDATLQPFSPPEILEGDLAPLALDLAVAGVTDPLELSWLDAPPAAAFSQARELLRELDAVDEGGRVTPHGDAMAQFGMHPRLSHMILRASAQGLGTVACDLAAILGERDPLRAMRDEVGTDMRARVDALRNPRSYRGVDTGSLKRVLEQSRRWRSRLSSRAEAPVISDGAIGRVMALAFPERVAQRRPGPLPRFLLRNGSGATLPEGDALGQESFLVIAESDGRVPEARAWLAAPLRADDVEIDFGDQIVEAHRVEWSDTEGVRAWNERRLGALVLSRASERDPDPELVAAAVGEAIRRRGLDVLPWKEGAQRLRQRIAFLHAYDPSWPDMSNEALLRSLIDRLHGALGRVRSSRDFHNLDMSKSLLEMLDWEQRRRLDHLAPTHFEAPTGSRLPIDYSDPQSPSVSVRLQELFGTRETPAVLGGRVALTLHLLSPAQRPVQVTRDLAGFWRNSYYDVRKDLRARYPKHSWPDDPLAAAPTRRTRRHDAE